METALLKRLSLVSLLCLLAVAAGCCINIGSCDAFSLADNIAEVDSAQCIGCGLCKGLCPKKAIGYRKI